MPESKRSSPAPLTAAIDRGHSPYFRSRKQILRNFSELLGRARRSVSGTTFLIQGAPGAGKTALLHECISLSKNKKWKAVKIHPYALWNSDALMEVLGRGREYVIQERTGTIHVSTLKGEYKSAPF